MPVDLHPDIVRAIRDFQRTPLGRRYNRYTQRRYDLPGWKVQAKTVAGEFGGRRTRGNRNIVSSAGARGPAQFIKSTRDAFVQRYGVDPWKNDRQAIKGMALHHLHSGGIAGYNPGMPSYESYIKSQRLNAEDRRALRGGSGGQPTGRPGTLSLRGPQRTDVGLQSYTIPGQSFEAERRGARRQLLLGGDINLDTLLQYKAQVNSLRDVPARKVAGDLQVMRSRGPGVRVPTRGGPPAAPRGRGPGKASVSPGADRAGVKTNRRVVQFGREISSIFGGPIRITTGTNHSQHTTTGNVSDHWGGNAADVPARGRRLIRMGQAALIAAGMSPARARKQTGGLYNVNGAQIIFNTQIGGDHTDHLHYRPPGIRRPRGVR